MSERPFAGFVLGKAHDHGLINENALIRLADRLLAGEPLTLDDLAEVFGANVMFKLLAPSVTRPRVDLYRVAAITGFASRPDDRANATTIVNDAEAVLHALRDKGVLA